MSKTYQSEGCELCDLQFPGGLFDGVLLVNVSGDWFSVWSSEWHAAQADREDRVLAKVRGEMLSEDQRLIGHRNAELLGW